MEPNLTSAYELFYDYFWPNYTDPEEAWLAWVRYRNNITLSQQELLADRILQVIRRYYALGLIGFGIVGNIISCVVFLKTRLKYVSGNHYLSAASISNSFFLVCLLLLTLTEFNMDVYNRPGSCQFVSFVSCMSTSLSLWTVVAFAVDRLIAHQWPHQAKTMCTPFKAKLVIWGLVVLAVVVYVNISLTVAVVHFVGKPHCAPIPLFINSLRWLNLVDAIVNIVICYLVLVAVIVTISYKFARRMRTCCRGVPVGHVIPPEQSSVTEGTQITSRQNNRAKVKRMTVLSLVFLSSVVLTRLPSELYRFKYIIRDITNMRYSVSGAAYYWQNVFQYLNYTSFAANLVIFWACDTGFRRHSVASVWNVFKKWRGSQLSHSSEEDQEVQGENEEDLEENSNSQTVANSNV